MAFFSHFLKMEDMLSKVVFVSFCEYFFPQYSETLWHANQGSLNGIQVLRGLAKNLGP